MHPSPHTKRHLDRFSRFWATVCKNGSPYAIGSLPCLSVCDIGVLWPNGWMDKNETWRAGRLRPWPHCVRWGPPPPPQKGHSPQFSAYICCRQIAGWTTMSLGMKVGLGPGDIVLDEVSASPPRKKEHSPQFLAHVYCGQTAGWIKTPLGTEVDLGPGHMTGSSSPRERSTTPPLFGHLV